MFILATRQRPAAAANLASPTTPRIASASASRNAARLAGPHSSSLNASREWHSKASRAGDKAHRRPARSSRHSPAARGVGHVQGTPQGHAERVDAQAGRGVLALGMGEGAFGLGDAGGLRFEDHE
jgi:hypothetical protein